MSRFYGEIQGNRGPASRMGSEKSGFWGHIRGWIIGARVTMSRDCQDPDVDVCSVCLSGGSRGKQENNVSIGRFKSNGERYINPAILKGTSIHQILKNVCEIIRKRDPSLTKGHEELEKLVKTIDGETNG